MKALITGIGGFVGQYLTDTLLAQNVQVYGTKLEHEVYTGKSDQVHVMDLMDTNQVDEVISVIKPDYIYHLAGQSSVGLSWENPELTINTNVIGTIHLLEAVKKFAVTSRVLIVGSSDEYGPIRPEQCPINEETTLSPSSPYATSKKAQEEIALQFSKAYNLDVVLVRAFNHIGPGQRKGFVVADFASQIAEIEKGIRQATIKVGNLEAKRDFTDVRDVVRAYRDVMTYGKVGEIYNVGSGRAYTIQELLDELIALSNIPIEVYKDPQKMRPSDIPLVQCDNRKLIETCKSQFKYSLKDTLLDTLDYWRKM